MAIALGSFPVLRGFEGTSFLGLRGGEKDLLAETCATCERPVLFILGANGMQVNLVAQMLNAYGIESYGAHGPEAWQMFDKVRKDVTHLLLLHGTEVVQRFRATLLTVAEHDLCSIDPVLTLGEPQCLRGIVISADTSQAE